MPSKLGATLHSAHPIRQRGFIQLPLAAWGAFGAGIVILLLGVAVKIQSARLESAKAETEAVTAQFNGFKIETKRLGDAAEKRRRENEAADKLSKEKADAQNQDDARKLADLRKRLRDERRARGNLVPPAAAGSPDPHRAAFDRALLDGALQRFVDGVEGLVGEGDKAVIDLNTARKWAQEKRNTP